MKTLIAFLLLAAPALAKPCRVVVQKQIVVANQVAVPFAIPVGVPVATAMPGGASYSANQYASPAVPPTSSLAAATAGDAALFEEFLAWRAQRVQAQAKAAPTAVTQLCARCHTENTRGAGVAHFTMNELDTCEGRLKAIRAVLSGKMPKGIALDPEGVGKVLEELAGEPPVEPPKAQLIPPAEPKANKALEDNPPPPKPTKEEP